MTIVSSTLWIPQLIDAHYTSAAAELFTVVYEAVTKPGNTVPHGREGLFIGENGTYAWGEVSDEIAKVLFEKGVGKSPEATTFTSDELVQYFGSEASVPSATQSGYALTISAVCRQSPGGK